MLGVLMMLSHAISQASCGLAGEPCKSDNAPAVQPADSLPSPAAGNPINVITGNKYQREADMAALPGVLGLELVRHYNSALSGPHEMPGPVGRGWRLSYETELAVHRNDILITQADGSQLIFGRDLVNRKIARHRDAARGTIAVTSSTRGDEYTWTWNDGRKLSFNSMGKLIQIQAATGEILSLQHDARGLLVRVTDPQNRSLRLVWLGQAESRAADRFRGVQSIETPVGRFSYGYGSPQLKRSTVGGRILLGNLVSVHYPADASGSRARRYHYEDIRQPTVLTGISFEQRDMTGGTKAQRYSSYGHTHQLQRLWPNAPGGRYRLVTPSRPGQVSAEDDAYD